LEQVPAVLELWSEFAGLLAVHGYHVATGVLGAEQYGVAQSRRRAFLIASLDGPVELPAPTHRSYDPRRPDRVRDDERHLRPWVSMGQALGWPERDGVVFTNSQTNGGRRPRGLSRLLSRPARTLDTSSGSWTIHPVLEDGAEPHYDTRQGWGRPRSIHKPAPTLGSSTPAIWVSEHEAERQPTGRYRPRRGIRVTVEQASVLQGFDPAYPWQGSRSAKFRQIGNAVCPPLARHVLAAAMRINPEAH
jgi:DNA (cytosine-5)-methyltransferase 1